MPFPCFAEKAQRFTLKKFRGRGMKHLAQNEYYMRSVRYLTCTEKTPKKKKELFYWALSSFSSLAILDFRLGLSLGYKISRRM